MKTYNAVVELDRSARAVDDDVVDDLMSHLINFSPAIGTSLRGRLEVTVTFSADNLAQAATTTLAVVGAAGERHSAPALTIELMPTEEFDARAGMQPLPSLIGATEAAKLLGVSRQRVVQLVDAGQLPAEPIGRSLVFARANVEAFAARDRGPGRPSVAR